LVVFSKNTPPYRHQSTESDKICRKRKFGRTIANLRAQMIKVVFVTLLNN
jgi:hypothetical protein